MKVFFIGDIFGRPGRRAVREYLPEVLEKYNPDLVIANVENLAGGKGATKNTLLEMEQCGINLFTGGNHIFHNPEVFETHFNKKIARPANLPGNHQGQEFIIYEIPHTNQKILLINLLGRVFIDHLLDCPFRKLEQILEINKKEKFEAIIVDFHAEATSEKYAFKHYFDGKISAIFGTHTHIATTDAQISKQSAFYVSDVGMSGPLDSVIGIKKEGAFNKFLNGGKIKFNVANGHVIFQGFLLDISNAKVDNFRRIEKIER